MSIAALTIWDEPEVLDRDFTNDWSTLMMETGRASRYCRDE
jgi:hypothetical protein